MTDERIELVQIIRWQTKLLPVIIKVIVCLTVFFFLASLAQLIYLQSRIEKVPDLDQNWIKDNIPNSQLYQLEYLTIQKRYHQGNTSLMSRIWLQYLGFITGMILVIIGAIFILGKLREPEAKIELSASQVKLSILSSSPGLIMVLLGTFIMITTILDHKKIEISDNNIYLLPELKSIITGVPPEKITNPGKAAMRGDSTDHPPK